METPPSVPPPPGPSATPLPAPAHSILPEPSRWLFPCLALVGPAIVCFKLAANSDLDGRYTPSQVLLLRAAAVILVLIAVAAAALEFRLQRASGVVWPRAAARGGRTTAWHFASVFALSLGLTNTTFLSSPSIDNNPQIVAIASYLWLAVVPSFTWTRHIKAMNRRLLPIDH